MGFMEVRAVIRQKSKLFSMIRTHRLLMLFSTVASWKAGWGGDLVVKVGQGWFG